MTSPLTQIPWRTSSHSPSGGGNCVEVGPTSTGVASRVAIRDTKDREGPTFLTSPNEWSGFVTAIKSGTFDA